nr:tensin-4-like isoform X2 [Leptinotarsa decemlineata]
MAYAAQLQKQTSFQDVIASQMDQTQPDKVLWAKELSNAFKKDRPPNQQQKNLPSSDKDVQLTAQDAATLRVVPPTNIPGLKTNQQQKFNVLGPTTVEKNNSQLSTPSSDESNSPTEMNSYKRMLEKPTLIKRITMGLTGNSTNSDEDSCPLVGETNTPSTPGSPMHRAVSDGYVNENEELRNKSNNKTDNPRISGEEYNSNRTKHLDIDRSSPLKKNEKDLQCNRISQISSSSSSSGQPTAPEGHMGSFTGAPTLPERTDSLNNIEPEELRQAGWFQAGIPREIALEILSREPVGAFMVRDSTTKPGCFALSLRVPRSFQPTGIAHYLILGVNKGYKIKGFTKEFSSLTSLITHHSVMPELLPCPLSLSRYQPNFVKSESERDFADVDIAPDYNTLVDFRKMMADLNV